MGRSSSITSRLIGYSIEAEFTSLKLKADDALARLLGAHHRAEADLRHLQNAYIVTLDEFRRFRERHRLERPPRDPACRWTTFGLLFVLIIVESMPNGFFFAAGSDYGVVGGVGIAVGITSCNVAFAFALGWGPFRWINHRNLTIKVLAILLSLAGVAAILALYTFAAHFRDVTAAGVDERAMSAAIGQMLQAPWVLADLSLFYLFNLGTVFGVVALWKGYSFDDPYPLYGARCRRLENARAGYAEKQILLFDDLDEIKEEAVREIANGSIRLISAETVRAQRAAMLQRSRAYEAEVETAAKELLARYWDKNREHREVPPHPRQQWSLPHSFLGSSEVKRLTADTPHESPDAVTMLAELESASRAVLEEYEDLRTKYPFSSEMR